VTKVTTPGTPDFIPEAERIAVFDNDGTLWSEQPMYVQLAFAFDRVKALAPQHPEWKTEQPFAAVLSGDKKTLETAGTAGLLKIVLATHGGMSSDEFRHLVLEWLKTARHPKYNRLYTELTYAPMVELLGYLRAHGFKTFIVSGGGVAFMRPWVEAAYGIPPEQVVGSRIKTAWKAVDGKGTLQRLPKIDLIDDGPDKPVGIQEMIGRQPVFAAGNSDGDLQMLQWTAQNNRPSISLIVHHTDAVREVAYDRQSHVGKLDKALDMAEKDGWLVVDMKNDWKTVFAFESAAE
jgi:phosphoglycolate phosphatase-like HAD superfamily hydrolase